MGANDAAVRRPPLTPFISSALRRCGYCARTPVSESDPPLRKCTGCERTAYCSKECQKAAWPKHKQVCDSYDADVRESAAASSKAPLRPLSSTRDADQLMGDYIEAHMWDFNAITSALIHRDTGPGKAPDWDARTRKVVLLTLKLNPASFADRNPANAFLLVGYKTTDLAECLKPRSARAVDRWLAAERPRRADVVNKYKDIRGFVGVAHLCLAIQDNGKQYWNHHPMFRAASSRDWTSDGLSRALRFALTLCVESARVGIPLCPSEPRISTLALPGRFVRTRAAWAWAWKPLFSAWADYRPGEHAEFDKVLEKVAEEMGEKDFDPEEMIGLFGYSLT